MANNQLLDNDLEQCLHPDNIKPAWNTLITDDQGLHNNIAGTLYFLRNRDDYATIVPTENQYLKAFSYAEPGDIKVVIIGTSPALSAGNDLAFSTNDYPTNSEAIKRFNKAAADAGIKNDKYHEVWARNGVLLVNAALSMSGEYENAEVIKEHNDQWLSFMKGFLSKWLTEYGDYTADHPLFVIPLGYATSDYRNYADELWSDVLENTKNSDDINIKTRRCQHPTFPGDTNFPAVMPKYFKEILQEYGGIFERSEQNPGQNPGENADVKALTAEIGNMGVKN